MTDSATIDGLQTVRFGAPVAEVMDLFARDGGVILEGILTPDELAQVNADIDPLIEALPCGSQKDDAFMQAFHGHRTKRLTNLITLSSTYRNRVIDSDITLGYVQAAFEGVSDTLWLQSSQVIEIHPGEVAQILHRDMANYPVFYRFGPEGPEVAVNLIVALRDSTDEAGATRIIPGSHKWPFREQGSQEVTIPAELKAGSGLFFSGKLIHGGGANRTTDVRRRVVSSAFNPGFLVPEEAYPFTVPMEVARQMSPRMQQLIGFRSFHQRRPLGGSLWQHNYEELAVHLGL